jgi:hypothetical protein
MGLTARAHKHAPSKEKPMATDPLQRFIDEVPSAWGPLSTETVSRIRGLLARLAQAPATEPWVAALRQDHPESRELHRDPEHGFLLLAHVERKGRTRPPHDHGRGWVIYAVLSGEMEMGTFARIEDPEAGPRLVKREACTLRAGDVRVYLPGDIHDTRHLTDEVLVLRFTSRDLAQEEREGWLTRYALGSERVYTRRVEAAAGSSPISTRCS